MSSVLSKLADAIQPTVEDKRALEVETQQAMSFRERQARQKTHHQHSQVARVLRVPLKARKPGRPVPTNHGVEMHDKDSMRMFTDGSVRHDGPRVRGKAAVKAAKRARQQSRRS